MALKSNLCVLKVCIYAVVYVNILIKYNFPSATFNDIIQVRTLRQVTTNQQATTFQLPEATQVAAGHEYILTISDSQPVSIPVLQPQQIASTQPATVIAKVWQPSRPSSVQSTSYVVVDDQQPGTSR